MFLVRLYGVYKLATLFKTNNTKKESEVITGVVAE